MNVWNHTNGCDCASKGVAVGTTDAPFPAGFIPDDVEPEDIGWPSADPTETTVEPDPATEASRREGLLSVIENPSFAHDMADFQAARERGDLDRDTLLMAAQWGRHVEAAANRGHDAADPAAVSRLSASLDAWGQAGDDEDALREVAESVETVAYHQPPTDAPRHPQPGVDAINQALAEFKRDNPNRVVAGNDDLVMARAAEIQHGKDTGTHIRSADWSQARGGPLGESARRFVESGAGKSPGALANHLLDDIRRQEQEESLRAEPDADQKAQAMGYRSNEHMLNEAWGV